MTGAFGGSIGSELATLRDNGSWFALPVFDRLAGNGNNTTYHVVSFAFVQLVDFQVSGAHPHACGKGGLS